MEDQDIGEVETGSWGCSSCGCLSFNAQFLNAFGVRLCEDCKSGEKVRSCLKGEFVSCVIVLICVHGADQALKRSTSSPIQLISKSQAKEAFLLTDKDLSGLGTLTRTNPQHKAWKPMLLFLQSQVCLICPTPHE